MMLILPPSASHDDAATIFAELMTTFGCVLGLSDSILSSSFEEWSVFAWCGVKFLSSSLDWRYAVTRVWRRV